MGRGSNGLLVAPNQVNRTEELTRIRQQQGWANCVIQFVDDVASARGVTLEQLGLGSETQEWLRVNRDTGNWVEGEYVGRLVQELGFSGIEEWSWPVPIDTTELTCTEVEQQVSPCSGYKNTIEDDHLVVLVRWTGFNGSCRLAHIELGLQRTGTTYGGRRACISVFDRYRLFSV